MVMCEIWSLGKKLLPQLSPPQVHGIIIDHWPDFYLCVFFAGSAYEVCHKSLYII